MAEVVITPSPNGPYRVSGAVKLVDASGKEWPVTPGQDVYLCRCGGSAKKPFCDGTHRRNSFQADTRVVAPSGTA